MAGRGPRMVSGLEIARIATGAFTHGGGMYFASTATSAVKTGFKVRDTIVDTVLGVWEDFVAQIPFIIGGLILILLTWFASFLVSRYGKRVMSRWALRASMRELLVRLINIGVWVLGLLLSAMVAFPGMTPAKALGALGVASIAVGFAFKDIFENFFAGILLLWSFPFEPGDFIECQGLMGKVEEVTIRNTVIRKVSGELVVTPNSILFKNPVHVLTNRSRRRVTITSGIAYGENIGEAVKVIEEAVRGCGTVDGSRDVEVLPREFGSSSIDIEVAWWTGSRPIDIRRSRAEVVEAVKSSLDGAGIEIPFPYRTLTFKGPVETRPAAGSGSGEEAASSGPSQEDP